MECRFCLIEGSPQDKANPLLQPCMCIGTVAFVHRLCLDRWRRTDIRVDQDIKCPICNSLYRVEILGFLREFVPTYKSLFETLLLNPFFMIFISNYVILLIFSFTGKISLDNSGLRVINSLFNLTNTYFYSHMLLLWLYLSVWLYNVQKVVNKPRYFRILFKRHFSFFVFNGTLLLLMPDYTVICGLPHHFLLPFYLKHHVEVLELMNGGALA